MSIRVYVDGQILAPAQASVPVLDRGFLFGDSVYETLAWQDGRFVFLTEHLARLERSAHRLYLDPPPRAHIVQAMQATALASAEAEARVRVIVTRGASDSVDIDPATATAPRLIVIVQPLGAPSGGARERGVAVVIVQKSRAAPGAVDPAIKSGNYLGSVLAIAEARRREPAASEAILCAPDGGIAEGATSNVFFVRDGTLATPSLAVGILDGVTRAKALELAHAAGIACRELDHVAPAELRDADEVFLTSAVRGILPVTVVDGTRIGDGRPGPVTRRLFDLYQHLVSEAR